MTQHFVNLSLLTMLVLFFSLLTCSFGHVSESCSRETVRIIKMSPSEKSCIAIASLLKPTSVLQFNGNVCVMIDACSDGKSSPDALPLYRMVANGPQMPLLRTRASDKRNPFQYLVGGESNKTIITTKQLNKNLNNYKCPLNELIGLFSAIHLTLSNDSDVNPDVNLTFAIDGSSSLSDGTWFAKEHLQTSVPWDINEMKKKEFSIFSLRGIYFKTYASRFYIGLKHLHACEQMQGYMVIIRGNDLCEFQVSSFKNSFLWVLPNESEGFFFKNRNFSMEFRLYGVLSHQYRLYDRL